MKARGISAGSEGQATMEMILLTAMIVIGILFVKRGMDEMKFTEMMLRPIQQDFAATYQFGHPKAKGFEDGGEPKFHPRFVGGDPTNLRIFLNPGSK